MFFFSFSLINKQEKNNSLLYETTSTFSDATSCILQTTETEYQSSSGKHRTRPHDTPTNRLIRLRFEPGHNIFFKTACVLSENSDQPARMRMLTRVSYMRLKTLWLLGYPQSALLRHWSDCAVPQIDMSLRLLHMQSCRNAVSRLIW